MMRAARLMAVLVLSLAASHAMAQGLNDPYSIMAPERVPARHHVHKSPMGKRYLPVRGEKTGAQHPNRAHVAHGSSGIVLPAPLPRTQLIPPEGGSAPIIRPAPPQQGAIVLPGVSPIPSLPHGPETFQDRASRCTFQQGLYNVPGNLSTQYMGACVQ